MSKEKYKKINIKKLNPNIVGEFENLDFNNFSLLQNEFVLTSGFSLNLTSGILDGYTLKFDNECALLCDESGKCINKIPYQNNYILTRFVYEYRKSKDYDNCRNTNDIQGYIYENLFGNKYNKLQHSQIKYSGDTMNSWKAIVKYLICDKDSKKTNENYYLMRNQMMTKPFVYTTFETVENYKIVNEFAYLSTTVGNSIPFVCKTGGFNGYRGQHLNDMIDKSLLFLKTQIDSKQLFEYTGFRNFEEFCDKFVLVGSFVNEEYQVLNLTTNRFTNNYADIKLLNSCDDNDCIYNRLNNINKTIKKRNDKLTELLRKKCKARM